MSEWLQKINYRNFFISIISLFAVGGAWDMYFAADYPTETKWINLVLVFVGLVINTQKQKQGKE